MLAVCSMVMRRVCGLWRSSFGHEYGARRIAYTHFTFDDGHFRSFVGDRNDELRSFETGIGVWGSEFKRARIPADDVDEAAQEI
jgi:hypothetical protein